MSVKLRIILGSVVFGCVTLAIGMHIHSGQRKSKVTHFPQPQSKIWAHSFQGKHTRKLNLLLNSELKDNKTVLTLSIQASKKLTDPLLQIQWILPPEVELTSGKLSDVVDLNDSSTPVSIEIEVTGFSEDDLKTIVVQVGNDLVPTETASIASRLTRAQQVIEVMHENDNE